jgi:hypothetical protein
MAAFGAKGPFAFPALDTSLLALLGISQAAYLGNKVVKQA